MCSCDWSSDVCSSDLRILYICISCNRKPVSHIFCKFVSHDYYESSRHMCIFRSTCYWPLLFIPGTWHLLCATVTDPPRAHLTLLATHRAQSRPSGPKQPPRKRPQPSLLRPVYSCISIASHGARVERRYASLPPSLATRFSWVSLCCFDRMP